MPQNGQPVNVSNEALKEAAQALRALEETIGWKILMIRLKAEADNAYEDLAEAEASDVNKIESLQRQIKRYKWFGETINALINDGLGKEDEEVDFHDA